MTAAETILAKALLPTHLDSAAIRTQIADEVRRRSLFSATVTREKYLLRLRDSLARILSGEWNAAKAREVLQKELDALGYDSEAGGFPGDSGLVAPAEKGSLQDLASRGRMDLALNTNADMARAVGQAKRGSSAYALWKYPAWSLERISDRRIPRDWWARWSAAGESVAWEGAAKARPSPTNDPIMYALKSSPIWQAIGDGAGGFEDTLSNPYPPFAFNSGMGWREVPREETANLRLGESAKTEPTLSPGDKEISDALKGLGPDFVRNLKKELGL